MKKILSTLLALVLVLSLATVAFAEEEEKWDGKYTASDEYSLTGIAKSYNVDNVIEATTLQFESSYPTGETNPDGNKAKPTVATLSVDSNFWSNESARKLSITIPSLSKEGEYHWIIKETAGSTAGVIYSTDEIHVRALVGFNNDEHKLEVKSANCYIIKADGNKGDSFQNTLNTGSFSVAKTVDGNMADVNDTFSITVTLTSDKKVGNEVTTPDNTKLTWTESTDDNGKSTWTATHTSNYSQIGGAKTFSNVPYGVTVTVSESVGENNTVSGTTTGGETKTYTYKSTTYANTSANNLSIAASDNGTITVMNECTATITTGIALDSMPYFLMLAVACMGLVFFTTKKRATREY